VCLCVCIGVVGVVVAWFGEVHDSVSGCGSCGVVSMGVI